MNPMIQQLQYNAYSETAAANYNSSSTSVSDCFIEILRNSTIIIETNEIICDTEINTPTALGEKIYNRGNRMATKKSDSLCFSDNTNNEDTHS